MAEFVFGADSVDSFGQENGTVRPSGCVGFVLEVGGRRDAICADTPGRDIPKEEII